MISKFKTWGIELIFDLSGCGIGGCWASPLAYKDNIYFFNEYGSTRIFKAGEPLDQLSENKLEGKFWASVAITGDANILKGAGKLICVKK